MIRKCTENDISAIYTIINEAAMVYQGVIPDDRWHEPYMSAEELRHEIEDGVAFWGYETDEGLVGVMGIQDRGDVDLIRHAYVRTSKQNQGIGTELLLHLEGLTVKPMLVGTWADATWAARFYKKNGYRLLPSHETERLLKRYWNIPPRQVETSVVLASPRWGTEDGFCSTGGDHE
jgi:GNAT superfamily N-acetyltransferase